MTPIDKKYGFRFAMESKPNEPRGDIYMASTGAYLGFIPTLDHPELVGVNPEVAHEHMAGLNFLHAVAQAWEAGKLFHIDLNDQAPGRYDQDFRFGAANIKSAFFLVKFLEDVGYDAPRHFDAHAYRTEDYDGVRDFARGCMRTYLILKETRRTLECGQGDSGPGEARCRRRKAAVLEGLGGRPRQAARRAVRPRRHLVEGPGLREARPVDDGSAARRQVADVGTGLTTGGASSRRDRSQAAVRHPKVTWTGIQFSASPMSTFPGVRGLAVDEGAAPQDDRRTRRKAADRRERRGQR